MRLTKIVCLLVFCGACQSNMNANLPSPEERVRDYLDRQLSDSPGLQYLVVDPAATRFAYAGGLADVAGRRAMDARTTFDVGGLLDRCDAELFHD